MRPAFPSPALASRQRPLAVLCALAAVLLLASGARAQVAVSAYADRTVVSQGGVVTFMVEITGVDDAGVLTPPDPSSNLRLQSVAPSLRRRTTFGAETRLTFGWRYQALASGPARLGPMRMNLGGRTYTTDPISLDVVPAQRPVASGAARAARGSGPGARGLPRRPGRAQPHDGRRGPADRRGLRALLRPQRGLAAPGHRRRDVGRAGLLARGDGRAHARDVSAPRDARRARACAP